MKIVFRVAYHTRPGQSLWLRLAISPAASPTAIASWFPMHWRDHRQWEAEVDISESGTVEISYHYQLRQEGNSLRLDEAIRPRCQTLDPARSANWLLEDTWRSAGTFDHVIRKGRLAPTTDPPDEPSLPTETGDHDFFLQIDFVPPGTRPCLIGSPPPLGGWDTGRHLPMRFVRPGLWHRRCPLVGESPIEYKYGLADADTGAFVSHEIGENRVIGPKPFEDGFHTVIADEAYRHAPSSLPRASGVAIPVFSLRSQAGLGVGEFADLKPFADWAAEAGMRLVQILPVNDTTSSHDWTDSYPYSAISAFALHPLYLRVDGLSVALTATETSELAQARDSLNAHPQVDYPAVMATKHRLAKAVFDRHFRTLAKRQDIRSFCENQSDWLAPYAAFCILRDRHGTADHTSWGEDATFRPDGVAAFQDPKHPDHREFLYHQWLQFELDRQLRDAVHHLRERGLVLKGDLPIGIDRDSVEVWSRPELFHTDRQAGAPPDAFAELGQNWGFPTYHWEAMAADGFAWWTSRLHHLGEYFQIFRIDHILGFFRIWQIPADQIDGILGWFEPAMPVTLEEIRHRGIPFEFPRHCVARARGETLREWLGDDFEEAARHYLQSDGRNTWTLRDEFSTQRRIADHFAHADPSRQRLRDALLRLATEVLFLEVPGSGGTLFHPRCHLQKTRIFQDLDGHTRWLVSELHDDYFFRRQDSFWQACGYAKLPSLCENSPMLLCGEDLGMVPDCVPGVMRELGILSLEIQRMPKSLHTSFAHPSDAPYLSVVSPSTHDMSTLRQWWQEDPQTTLRFARDCLGIHSPPAELTCEIAQRILHQHAASPAMWAIFPLQDLLAIDEELRHPDPSSERINIPAITPYYWRYRCHIDIAELQAATGFTSRLRQLVGSR